MLTRFWDAVRSMVQEAAPEPIEQLLPVSDLSVTDPVRVRDLLAQRVNSRLPLTLQGDKSADLGTATVFAVATGEHHVGLGFQGMDHADARTMRRWLNAAEVTSIGPA